MQDDSIVRFRRRYSGGFCASSRAIAAEWLLRDDKVVETSVDNALRPPMDLARTQQHLDVAATMVPDPDHVCDMLAWIGTDLVECMEPWGQSCRFACPSADSLVFCTSRVRKRMAQILLR